MAITYDYRVNETGEALGSIVNTASSSAALSGLTTDTNHTVTVRQRQSESGVLYFSEWVSVAFQTAAPVATVVVNLLAISHSVTLNGISSAPAVFADLGVISHSAALNQVTPFVSPSGNYFDLRIDHIEGGVTIVSELAGSPYELTGLISGDSYEVSVRSVNKAGGVAYYSLWSSADIFEAGSAQPVQIDLEVLSHTVTLQPVQAVASTVVVNLGLLSHSATLNSVNVISLVHVNLASISSSVTLNTITPVLDTSNSVQYTLRVEQEGGSTSLLEDVTSPHVITGLVEDDNYDISLKKDVVSDNVQYKGLWSAPASITATQPSGVIVVLGVVGHSVTLNSVVAIDTDFIIDSFGYTNVQGEPFRLLGTASVDIQSMSITIDGVEMAVSFNGKAWNAILSEDAMEVTQLDELDGYQFLAAGNTVLEVI